MRRLTVLIFSMLLAACAADRLHKEGLDALDRGAYEEGIDKLEQALKAEPSNLSYRLDVRARREAAVQQLIATADAARSAGKADLAESTYRRVLVIEPANDRARKGLEGVTADRRHGERIAKAEQLLASKQYDSAESEVRAVLAEDPGFVPATTLATRIATARGPTAAAPRLRTAENRPVSLQFRDAPTKMVFEVLSRQTGINFIFDKDVKSDSKTTIFVAEVPIEKAIDLVLGQNQLARQVLAENMVLIYPNTQAKQKDYQDQIVKTFYLNTATPKDVESLLKTVLDAKTLVVNERANALTIRDTPEVVRMAEKLVASVDLAEPEVMLEVEVLEVTRSRLNQLGITYPNSATLATPGNLVLNDVVRNTGVISGDTITVSPFSATLDALKTNSNSNVLASPRIRARNKEKAKILIGSRVPTITTAVTPTGLTGTTIANTQVQYLEVGLTLNVEPTIYADNDVAIKVGLEVSSIVNTVKVGQTIAYEIGTRNADTLLQLKDGETQILAGLIRDSDTHSATKIPGLGDIPLIGRLFADHHDQKDKSEIVLSITPRIIRPRGRPSNETSEFWYGTESRAGMMPLSMAQRSGAPMAPGGSAGGGGAAPENVSSGAGDTTVGAVGFSSAGMGGAAPTASGGLTEAPSAKLAAITGVSPIASAKPAVPEGPPPKVDASLSGPSAVKVGDEFTVTLTLNSDQPVTKARAQVRWDASAFQLEGGDPGGAVPSSSGAKVIGRSGGAQLDLNTQSDDPMSSGEIIVLKFKATQARPKTAIAGQVSVMSSSGTIVGSATPAPLTIEVGM